MLEDERIGMASNPSWIISELAGFQRFHRASSADPQHVTHTENPGVHDKDKWKEVI